MPESPVPESPGPVLESSIPEATVPTWGPWSFRQPAVESPSIVDSEAIALPSPKASKKSKIKKVKKGVVQEAENDLGPVNVIESSRPSPSHGWGLSEV